MYNCPMFSASNTISRAMKYYLPRGSKRKTHKIFVFGNKKNRYYCADRRSYRMEYLKSDHWKKLKAEKLLVSPVCEMCGTDKWLDVHHLDYKNLYDVTISDLKTLCRKCHIGEHNKLKEKPPITFQEEKSRLRNVRRNRRKNKNYNPLDDELFKQEELYLEGLKKSM